MSELNIELMRDLILVRPDLTPKKSMGGLLITNHDKISPKHGLVLATGPGIYNAKGNFVPCPCVAGDKVIYSQRDAIPYYHGHEQLWIIPSSEILLKLTGGRKIFVIDTDKMTAEQVTELIDQAIESFKNKEIPDE